MATSLENLRDSVRIELRDPDGITFQDPDIDHAVNQAYRTVFMRIAKMNRDYFVTSETFDLVSGTDTYDLPDNCLRVKRVEYIRNNQEIPLFQYVRGKRSNYTGNGGSLAIRIPPYTYDFEGDSIIFEPTPQESLPDGIKITFTSGSTTLVNDSDEIHPNFKDMWVDSIVLLATKGCLSQIEAGGALVSVADFESRLKTALDILDSSVILRTLSPKRRTRRGFFQ